MNQKVLVVGGTGQVGSLIVRKLLDRGAHDVYILVRNRPESLAKAQPLVELGAKIVQGDLLDPSSLYGVVDGIDQIICTTAALDTSLTKGYETLIFLAENADVDHLLYLTNIPRIEPLLPLFKGKQEIEALVSQSTLNHTILKAEPFLGYVVEYMIKMALSYGYPVGLFAQNEEQATKGIHYWIAEDDVAELCVGMIGHNLAFDKTYYAGGNVPMTLKQVIDRYGELNGVVVPTMVLPEPPPGLPQDVYDIVSQLFAYDSRKPDQLEGVFTGLLIHPDDIIRQK